MDRRHFLRHAGFFVEAVTCQALMRAQPGNSVALVISPADPIASAQPCQWAAQELEQALTDMGMKVRRCDRLEQIRDDERPLMAAGSSAQLKAILASTPVLLPNLPESLALFEIQLSGHQVLVACGADPHGLSYALCELADRMRFRLSTSVALQVSQPLAERPSNPVRSIMRQFTSELFDKPWFNDREQWPYYLSMLAAQRFNRFDLAFGLGYDSLNQVTDSYFLFLYPFLLAVPGYNVRATNLSDSERDHNLEMLRFVSEQTVARGIEFQLGIWMHGYSWPKNPRVRYMIEGLTRETHAPYCRDALMAVLQACPAISSVGLRIHGESGVAEGSYEFWNTIFDGVKRCGRTVEIDLHAKGIDERMIANALATGMPVNVSPKFSAEHQAMPYQQAAIRELEMPVTGHTGTGLMTISEGVRVFTRSSYADLLREDRKYTVRYRMFSGTQRILLWNDPGSAAAYSRSFGFCGSTGADLMEPLTCRGRRGSAEPGRRSGYIDARLESRWDWQKYAGWYRTWGRLMYNPDSDPEACRRPNSQSAAGRALQSALASAGRILPIVTTAYLPSVACDAYWPEIYWNQPMIDAGEKSPYSDTLLPKVFQNASPLDPQLFQTMSESASELLGAERSGKYSMIEVAQWLEDYAVDVKQHLAQAGKPSSPEFMRETIDAVMQAGLGQFFAAKFRAGVLYAVHERTGDRRSLEEALRLYRSARAHWAEVADRAKRVYASDLSASDRFSERGQWLDRLAGIDQDIARLEQRLASAKEIEDEQVGAAITEILTRPRRASATCRHQPPAGFRPREPVDIALSIEGRALSSARLYYRHVNQAERFQKIEMEESSSRYRTQIPGAYTDSPYPLQYYFELKETPKKAWLYPGFTADRTNQPYFVLRRS